VRAQGRTPAGTHVPVLPAEMLDILRPAAGETLVDCTLGYGGHAIEFLKRIAPNGRLIGMDLDGPQLQRTAARLADAGYPVQLRERGGAITETAPSRGPTSTAGAGVDNNPDFPDGSGATASSRANASAAPPSTMLVTLVHGNFAGMEKALRDAGTATADVIFADLGVSSMQIDDDQRGFSYKQDGPLDMRMDPTRPRSAADLLGTIDAAALATLLRDLADEPLADAIAQAVVEQRRRAPLRRTRELAALIERVAAASGRTGPSRGRRFHRGAKGDRSGAASTGSAGTAEGPHPAARTFQALRIAVNDELAALEHLLRVAPGCLNPGGRLGIVSFHSGEDRRVKHALREGLAAGLYSEIASDVVRPGPEERRDNPRSGSARLRWAIRAG